MSNEEIDAQYYALLEMTNGNHIEAMYIVCLDISIKESTKNCG